MKREEGLNQEDASELDSDTERGENQETTPFSGPSDVWQMFRNNQ